ncbi:hypothetical protein [uncultured Piscinibacter sp.]|uniref:hypothetical protein n=1 Tax=uncultured Piscinibacter sp. TaxID=1131835 RepID=UPI00261C9A30|nr:hypothetical protein [uncultured Piscinibacter sp.]
MIRTDVRGICRCLCGITAAVAQLALAGCMSVAPARITADRIDFGWVIAESWKRQTLLNVVRLRHADAPVFLEVASIINSYSVGGKANASVEAFSHTDPAMLGLGVEGTWSNTPTVTYQPLTGARFTQSLLRPIPPAALVQLLQGGWPVELVMQTVVSAANGLRGNAPGEVEQADFGELVQALSRMQRAGALGIRVDAGKNAGGVVIVLRGGSADVRLARDRDRVVELLGLEPGVGEFEVVYGLVPRHRREVAIISRSMLELMLRLGGGVELPDAPAGQERAMPFPRQAADPSSIGLARIRSGSEAPADAYAAVPYRGHWYWIDDTDVASKRIFTFLLILFSLAETGPSAAAPVVTVPSR